MKEKYIRIIGVKENDIRMKAMFISKELNRVSGSNVSARMHRDCLAEILGEENLITIDLSPNATIIRSDNYISYGKYKSVFARIKRHLQGFTYDLSKKIVEDICVIIIMNKISFVFIDDSTYGKLVQAIKRQCPETKVVSFFHDVKAHLYPIWMSKEKLWVRTIDMRIGLKNEKLSTNSVDANIVLNRDEDSVLYEAYGKSADYFLPVCVPKGNEKTSDVFEKSRKKHILFVGTSYYPNKIACRWFATEVLPEIRENYDFYIVGKGLECLREEISDPDVHLVGFAESLASYYEYADCVIAPLIEGGGMKIKTAEAFSFGKVFLGSKESLSGYFENIPEKSINNIVFLCESKEDYIISFNKLNKIGIKKHNADLTAFYEEKHSPIAAVQYIRIIIEETLNQTKRTC